MKIFILLEISLNAVSNEETNRVSNFLIRIAEDPVYKRKYDENPTKIMDEASIPKDKQVAILGGDIENIQKAVGIGSLNYMLVHTET